MSTKAPPAEKAKILAAEKKRILAALVSLRWAASGRSAEHVKAANEAIQALRKPSPSILVGIVVTTPLASVCLPIALAKPRVLDSLAEFIVEDLPFLDELPAPEIVPCVEQLITELGGKVPKPCPAVFDATTGILTLRGRLISTNDSVTRVLKLLVDKRKATMKQLQIVNDRPDQVLKRFLEGQPKMRPFIKLPGKGNSGGYSTTIEPACAEL
jgi:hypothetical protein